jgi:thymidylate synthase
MAQTDHTYEGTLLKIMQQGVDRGDRTGTGTRGLFGLQMRWRLADGFPLITTKRVFTRPMVEELLWFLSGSTNNNDLTAKDVHIWDAWARPDGDLGPIYGHQLRRAGSKPVAWVQPKPNLRSGVEPTYLGVASGSGKEKHDLAKTWEGMIARCYDKDSQSYKTYGARGVHVCDRWLEFSVFAKDCESLPGWSEKLSSSTRHVLDKDIRGSGFTYGPESCTWVTDKENLAASSKTLYTVERDGEEFSFTNVSEFCADHGVDAKNFSDLWTGAKNAGRRGGFSLVSVKSLSDPGVDQIAEVIESIRTNPESRRHVVSAWNPTDIPGMALAPCHCLFQFWVADGALSCQLYQRSADMFLGVPWNIASYALLTHMVAQQCDLGVGDFIWTGGDCHIYHNHFDQVNLQLTRMPKPFPTLQLRRKPSVFDYELADVDFLNYEYHPAIKAEVAV